MIVILEYEEKKVQECDGCGDTGGDFGFGMGEVTPGGPDRFDLGFGMSPFTQAAPHKNSRKKKVKLKRKKK